MARVVVYHGGYGCDTGCCGHYLELDNELYEKFGPSSHFDFSHPYGAYGKEGEDQVSEMKRFAEDFIRRELGEEHVADLDWENSFVTTD